MTLLYYDPMFMEHRTGDHPERPARLVPTLQHLRFSGLDSVCTRPSWNPASVARLGYVHTPAYIESVRQLAESGGGMLDGDTFASQKSYEVARFAAGAVGDAVERVIGGEDKTAFCMVRPPGHHAMPDHAMGFCLFNNVAIGARVATEELAVPRVLIVDFDVHHGNGTQAMFWSDPNVGYFSMHRVPLYPGTGAADEIGGGPGRGATLNMPVALGTPREQQLEMFEEKLRAFAARIQPQLILVSAGFDSHKADPIGSLGLESADFGILTRILLEVAQTHSGGRLVSVLEGGYHPEALSECITIHLEELLRAD